MGMRGGAVRPRSPNVHMTGLASSQSSRVLARIMEFGLELVGLSRLDEEP
jgi:hypothetical protein